MAPQPSKHGRCTRLLVFFLPTLVLSPTAALAAVVPTSYSSHCASPFTAPDRHPDDVSNDDAELLSSFHVQPSTGFFSGHVDLERTVTVASMMLFCVYIVIWRLRASKKNHEEPTAMSMAMHVVIISLGCVVALDFILSHWVFFLVTFVHMFS